MIILEDVIEYLDAMQMAGGFAYGHHNPTGFCEHGVAFVLEAEDPWYAIERTLVFEDEVAAGMGIDLPEVYDSYEDHGPYILAQLAAEAFGLA